MRDIVLVCVTSSLLQVRTSYPCRCSDVTKSRLLTARFFLRPLHSIKSLFEYSELHRALYCRQLTQRFYIYDKFFTTLHGIQFSLELCFEPVSLIWNCISRLEYIHTENLPIKSGIQTPTSYYT